MSLILGSLMSEELLSWFRYMASALGASPPFPLSWLLGPLPAYYRPYGKRLGARAGGATAQLEILFLVSSSGRRLTVKETDACNYKMWFGDCPWIECVPAAPFSLPLPHTARNGPRGRAPPGQKAAVGGHAGSRERTAFLRLS